MHRSSYHHGDLRAALLTSALQLVETLGPEQLSMRAVARQAGVSANAPYNHYADKDALLVALASHGFHQVRDQLTAALEAAEPGDELASLILAGVRHALACPGLYRLMVGHVCSTDPATRAAADEAKAVVMDGLGVRPGDPAGEARFAGVWAFAQGLAVLLVDGSLKPAEHQDLDEYVRAITHATLGPGSASRA